MSRAQKEDPSFVDKIFEIERQEWLRLSISLRQHGLAAIDVIHPSQVSRFSDVVILSADVAKLIRQSLVSLMREVDRRQELVHEMVITNNQLREELKAQSLISLRLEDEVRKQKTLLTQFNNNLQDSCDESRANVTIASGYASDGERLNALQLNTRCDQLRQKCELLEQEVARLTVKNERFILEEDKRRNRETEVFEHLRKKPGKENFDDTLLSIIDSYERQISEFSRRVDAGDKVERSSESVPADTTANYKALVKVYEKNVRDLKKKLKTTEDECEMLKLELQSRPQLKDVREAQLKAKQLEQLVRNLRSTNKSQVQHSLDVTTSDVSSSLVTDIDFMHSTRCRQYLKLVCEELNINDLNDIVSSLRKVSLQADAYSQLEQFARDVLRLVEESDVPRPAEYQHHNKSTGDHEVWCEKTWKHVLPTLEYWTLQLRQLKELQLSIKRMVDRLFPWQRVAIDNNSVTMTTAQLIDTIDSLIYDDVNKSSTVKGAICGTEAETKAMLQGIVGHFQKLFDVRNVVGVYARMSDIYRKLGETHNILTTLKNFLGLDESVKSGAVVDAVAQLCESRRSPVEQRLATILNVDTDTASIVSKVEEYQEFFTTFHDVMQQLLVILAVRHIDEVVPAVKMLRSFSTGIVR